MHKFIGLAVLWVCLLASVPASAQTCVGRTSFGDTPWEARVESGYSRDVRSFGPSVYRGSGAFFGGVSADLDGYTTLSQTAVAVGATVGIEQKLRSISNRVYVCPVGTFIHQFGPNLDTADISANVLSFGGRIGIVAFENQSVQIVPTIGMDAQRETDSITPSGSDKVTGTNTFTVTRLGVGFVIGKRTSLVPEIIQLFGTSASTTFRLSAVFGFGK
jgi:hypothetical protein